MISYGKQNISQEDIESVVKVLNSDFLTQGPKVPEFEQALSLSCNAKFCTAVTNATAALHLALLSIDVGPGDIVWTTPITFAATANAIRLTGADIMFIDIDITTFNIDPLTIEKKLHQTQKSELPKAIIAVHMAGSSVNMKKLHQACQAYNIKLIEDASHALGATSNGALTGSCAFSDITVFSFHPVKMITTAEGGAILTNSQAIDSKVKLLRTHGITRDHQNPNYLKYPWYYEQTHLGYNYRMSDLQAALGLTQLKKLDRFVSKRNMLANVYKQQLENSSVHVQKTSDQDISSYHLFIIRLQNTHDRDNVYTEFLKLGVRCNFHYIPIYRFPYYVSLYGKQEKKFPNSELYFRTALTIPLYVDLSSAQIEEFASNVIATIS